MTVAVVTALFGLVMVRLGSEQSAVVAIPAYLTFSVFAVVLTTADVATHRLPNRMVLASAGVGVVLLGAATLMSGEWGAFIRSLIGGAALFVFYLGLALAVPRGMGMGDVKLAFVVGLHLAWIGWGSLVVGAFSAFVFGGVFSFALLATKQADRATNIPFGPWMLGGAFVGIVFGERIARGYLALVGLA